ncbi:MAG: cob(I)yrinic acid a,c-diamide adenosyltransferase [Clostridiales Family XIII bacterium]|nr:cob(I)yrinic acid a,c-diamide adenosyltransferase [Clostridiales Family XIII bacterium]
MYEKVLKTGYVQIYTGDGKGKSTAAFGLAMRMAGRGGRVYIARFMKGLPSGECTAVEAMNRTSDIPGESSAPLRIECEDFGEPKFIIGTPSDEDIELAHQGLRRCMDVVSGGDYDLVVLDEIINAVYFKVLSEDEVLELVHAKADHTEVVLTGRNASQRLIDRADLVTEMKEIKHYYKTGVPARRGIED